MTGAYLGLFVAQLLCGITICLCSFAIGKHSVRVERPRDRLAWRGSQRLWPIWLVFLAFAVVFAFLVSTWSVLLIFWIRR